MGLPCLLQRQLYFSILECLLDNVEQLPETIQEHWPLRNTLGGICPYMLIDYSYVTWKTHMGRVTAYVKVRHSLTDHVS
jgi:hypothetical protein